MLSNYGVNAISTSFLLKEVSGKFDPNIGKTKVPRSSSFKSSAEVPIGVSKMSTSDKFRLLYVSTWGTFSKDWSEFSSFVSNMGWGDCDYFYISFYCLIVGPSDYHFPIFWAV